MSLSYDYIGTETHYMTLSTVYTNESNDDFAPTSEPKYNVPIGYNAVLLVGTLLIIIVGLIANAAVLFIVMFEQLRNSPNSPVHTINTYITNLASADILYIFGAIFWSITNYDQSGWKFGDFGCRGVFFLEVLTLHASAYILTVMTIERYMAIIYPMSSLRFRNIRVARKVSTCVWVSAFIIALPALLMKMTYFDLGGGDFKPMCDFSLGNDAFNRYMTALAVVTFIIPSFLMVAIYFKMFTHLYGVFSKENCINEEAENSRQLQNSSRRAAKSVFIIVIVWLVCFFPYWLNHFLHVYFGLYKKKMFYPMITILLTYLNSTLNPFLYTLMPRSYNVSKKLRPKPSSNPLM